MKTLLDAQPAGRMAPAAVARPRVGAALGGRDLGMYPCGWRAGNHVVSIHDANFAITTSHKAWRPKESSP